MIISYSLMQRIASAGIHYSATHDSKVAWWWRIANFIYHIGKEKWER